jgi:prepilin-type N-terminal cleavage/methylation domain-containing protein
MVTTMLKKRHKAPGGFTLVELMVAAAVMVIVFCAVGVLLVDGQRGWNNMYDHVNADVVTDGYVVRKLFDSVIRKASGDQILVGGDGSWLEVNFYADGSTVVDRYARFYASDGDLNLEVGQLEPRATLYVNTVCGNVSGCTFTQAGRSSQMILTLDNEKQTNTIVSSAVSHNQ